MAESIKINPEVLHEVARHHDTVADQIADARRAGDEIHAAVQTYGPIMHQVKDAVADLLAERDQALLAHHDRHRAAADVLRRQANAMVDVEDENKKRLTFE